MTSRDISAGQPIMESRQIAEHWQHQGERQGLSVVSSTEDAGRDCDPRNCVQKSAGV